jgi:hypothetical protein
VLGAGRSVGIFMNEVAQPTRCVLHAFARTWGRVGSARCSFVGAAMVMLHCTCAELLIRYAAPQQWQAHPSWPTPPDLREPNSAADDDVMEVDQGQAGNPIDLLADEPAEVVDVEQYTCDAAQPASGQGWQQGRRMVKIKRERE